MAEYWLKAKDHDIKVELFRLDPQTYLSLDIYCCLVPIFLILWEGLPVMPSCFSFISMSFHFSFLGYFKLWSRPYNGWKQLLERTSKGLALELCFRLVDICLRKMKYEDSINPYVVWCGFYKILFTFFNVTFWKLKKER